MINSNNILLITDYEEVAKSILEKLILLRENDSITVCNTKSAKKILENSLYYVIILHELENKNATLKVIKNIKNEKEDCEIILLLNNQDKETILDAYDAGICDYFFINSENYEMLIKTVNCFKLRLLKEKNRINEIFLNQLGVIDTKTKLYSQKHLKEIFIDLSENQSIQNGTFAVITLDNKNKTKVSTNRLALILKNTLRNDDIIASGRGGKFFIIMPNINILNAKSVLQKIQNKMGTEHNLRAGISKIGIQSFETINKKANDSLTSAINNDKMFVCLENNIDIENTWLNDTPPETKTFKLFKNAFLNKLEKIISPKFYRYQKDCQSKLKNTIVSQYTNDIECVFCLKNKNLNSELVLRYDGFAKFYIEITHSGLESPENSSFELGLNKITDKKIAELLNQVKDEHITAQKKED